MPAAATESRIELPIGWLRETRSGLVGLGSRRWVVTLSTRSFKVSVVCSEEFTAPLDVTVTPHCRQKFASGSSSAPHVEHRGTLITRQNTTGICFRQASLSERGALATWSAGAKLNPASSRRSDQVATAPCSDKHHCRVRAFCDTQSAYVTCHH